ncbi:hypothetical protein FACS1894170_07410 [Planctomycetales bacterium]|nr:hypothetical protein FACS1894170_07410 [Planctomycetales bacterium]
MSYSEKIQTAIDQLEALRKLSVEERKVRLAELKEHFRLIGLYNAAASADGEETGNAADSEELAAVREHFEPLRLAAEGTPVSELARLAALQITKL